MRKTTLYFDDDLDRRLAGYLRRTGRAQSEVVREALARYLAEEDGPRRPRSIGIVEDGTLDPAEYEAELGRAWGDETPGGETRRASDDPAANDPA
jgi:hypothetical protein